MPEIQLDENLVRLDRLESDYRKLLEQFAEMADQLNSLLLVTSMQVPCHNCGSVVMATHEDTERTLVHRDGAPDAVGFLCARCKHRINRASGNGHGDRSGLVVVPG